MFPITNKEIEQARNRFYPGWWTYSPIETRTSLQPLYIVPCSSEGEIQLAKLAKPPFIRAEIFHRDVLESTQAKPDEVDALLTRLKDAGLDDPTSPYAEEGRRQMRDALTRLSHVMKQIRNQQIEADVERDVQEMTEAAKAIGWTIRDDPEAPEALDYLRQELRDQWYRRLP